MVTMDTQLNLVPASLIQANLQSKQGKYYLDGNNIKLSRKRLAKLTDIVSDCNDERFYIGASGKNGKTYYHLWININDICFDIVTACTSDDFNDVIKSAKHKTYTEEQFIKTLEYARASGYYINNLEIEMCRAYGREEFANELQQYHDMLLEKAQLKAKREEEERRKARELEAIKKRDEIMTAMNLAEQKFRNGVGFANEPLNNGNTVVFELMKKYCVPVPIKTMGWINQSLSRIFFENGNVGYYYYRSHGDSKVFQKYLRELNGKINMKVEEQKQYACANV